MTKNDKDRRIDAVIEPQTSKDPHTFSRNTRKCSYLYVNILSELSLALYVLEILYV